MITIQKSHSLITLVSLLGGALKEKRPYHPLHPQTIIVPNLDTSRWLKLELAERMNIAANLDCILPSEWQYRQIRQLYPDLPKKLPSDILPMTGSIYNILIDKSRRSEYERIDQYVKRQPEENIENATWQLSAQIASVFDAYIVYRPELLLGWQEGRIGRQPDEEWQAHLWNLLNTQWKRLPDKHLHRNRVELYRDLLQAVKSNRLQNDSALFVFNSGLIPKPIFHVLKGFGNDSDVRIYHITPSKSKVDLSGPMTNPLLASFGRESQDLITVYEEIFNDTGNFVEYDEEIHTPKNRVKIGNKKSVLHQIQTSIIQNDPAPAEILNDDSVQIHSCHSPLREVETLHQTLLELFEKDQTLHPDDVLVATPDPEAYEPFIRAVFGTVEEGLPEIPWHVSLPMKRDQSPVRTFTQWLQLPDSRFQFHQVMELFSMKPVWEKAGLNESDVEAIKVWMEENSVIWGLDKTHRSEVGQPATDYQTWESALRRGWYGQWMADKPGLIKKDILLYTGIQTSSQMEAWAAFSAFMNGLDRFRKEIKEPRTAIEWCEQIRFRFEQLVGSDLLGTPEGSSIIRALETIEECISIVSGDQKIPFSLFRNILNDQMEQSGSSGAVFTRGVTFSSMVPVRSIPFRVVALIGLNDHSFPRKQPVIDFDLMAQTPRPGERNRKFEDRNLFLESILATQKIHYVSYIGQSPVDNEELPPSTIVSEWIDQVASSSGRVKNEVVMKESLHSFSEVYFKQGKTFSPTAFEAAKTLNKNENNSSGLRWSGPLPENKNPSEWITVSQLTRFYKNPIRTFVADQLEAWLRDPENDKDEFSSSYLEQHILFQQLFGWTLKGMTEKEMYDLVRQSGQLPDGFTGEHIFNEKMTQCKTALRFLNEKGVQLNSTQLEVDVEVNGVRIYDVISTYLDGNVLDITPSSLNGALLIQTWIRHLVWNLSKKSDVESNLFCEIKDSGPYWVSFKPVESPNIYLKQLIDLYQAGQNEPLLFFPKTIYKYEETDRGNKKYDPLINAAIEFEGGFKKIGERMNINTIALLGPDASFTSAYVEEPFRSLISTMMDHMEVLK